jgi:hypothetical protein
MQPFKLQYCSEAFTNIQLGPNEVVNFRSQDYPDTMLLNISTLKQECRQNFTVRIDKSLYEIEWKMKKKSSLVGSTVSSNLDRVYQQYVGQLAYGRHFRSAILPVRIRCYVIVIKMIIIIC